MAIDFDDDGGSDFFGGESQHLKAPGTYHFLISHASEQPTSAKGALIPNAILQLQLTVADGPQKDKTLDMTFFGLKADASAKAKEWHNRKLIRIAYAAGLIGNANIMGKIGPIEFTQAKGRQVVMTVDQREDKDGAKTEYLDMVFANVWHVDDPSAPKDAVKNAGLINLLPAGLRRTPEYFAELRKFEEAKKAGVSGGANGSTGKPTPPSSNSTAPAANVSVGDLV